MPTTILNLEQAGPLCSRGAEQQLEWRIPSLRGTLRTLIRAHYGAYVRDPADLYRLEGSLMGTVNSASPVSLAFLGRQNGKADAVKHFASTAVEDKNAQGKNFPSIEAFSDTASRASRKDIQTAETLQLQIGWKPGTTLDQRFLYALGTWLLLGGMGHRSHRFFGGMQLYAYDTEVITFNFDDYAEFNTSGDLADTLQQHLADAQQAFALPNRPLVPDNLEPQFPTLHPAHSRVVVSHTTFNAFDDLQNAWIGLLQALNVKGDRMLGSINPRRASPIIAQARVTTGQTRRYVMVLTAMRSKIENPDWGIVDKVLDAVEGKNPDKAPDWKGETVWGQRFVAQR